MIQKWEYLTEQDTGFASIKIGGVKYKNWLEYLNERGRDGWELVQAPSHATSTFFFKRPINN